MQRYLTLRARIASTNLVDWIQYRKKGIKPHLIQRKLEYLSEKHTLQSIKSKTLRFSTTQDESLAIAALTYRQDGRYIAASLKDHSVRVIDPLSGKEIAAHYAHLHTAWTLKWHPRNPEILASGSAPGMIVLWNVLDKRIESRAFVNSPEMINSIDFHPSYLLLYLVM